MSKWNLVGEELPEDDRTVVCYIDNKKEPHWSGVRLGSYLNNNWYLQGGRASHEIVSRWIDIPKYKTE